MHVNAAYKHAVLFDYSKPRCCLACSSEDTLVISLSHELQHPSGSMSLGEFQCAYFVAMPEHRARTLSATRSPRRSFLAGPVTVATLATGSNSAPSVKCHSTLFHQCK